MAATLATIPGADQPCAALMPISTSATPAANRTGETSRRGVIPKTRADHTRNRRGNRLSMVSCGRVAPLPMATCPRCKGHLTDSHRCPRHRGMVALEIALAAIGGGFLGLLLVAIFDPHV